MKRLQIVIVVIAVLSVAGLYSLPRVVVDNDKEKESPGGLNTVKPFEEGLVNHSAEIPAEAVPRIDKWKAGLYLGGNMVDNEPALDSLMLVFQSINRYDSAAYYAGQYADSYPGEKNWRKAGNAYFEAFTFAVDEAKSQLMTSGARLYYNQILESGVKDLGIKNNMAMMLISGDVPMQGIMMLREIIEEDPENLNALFNLGILAIRTQQFERALERFETLVGYHPDHIEGNMYLGMCLYETGNLTKAKAQFEKIKEMDINERVRNLADDYLGRIK